MALLFFIDFFLLVAVSSPSIVVFDPLLIVCLYPPSFESLPLSVSPPACSLLFSTNMASTSKPPQPDSTSTSPPPTHASTYTRTSDVEDLPHATKKRMADHLRRLEMMFTLTPQRMRIIVEAFKDTLELGLSKHGQVVPMIPTYVFGWPSGSETGNYLAVDLGGTNLRVCLVTLNGGGKFEITQAKYRLTEEQKQEDGQKLFDFCAEC
ncbi:hexokinase-domain-containing protein, partial [Abortiporus biennis]